MFSVMQDPGVGHRLTQLYTEERTRAAAAHRVSKSVRATAQPPAPAEVTRPRRHWRVRVLRPSFR